MGQPKESVQFVDIPDMPGVTAVRAAHVRADMGRHAHAALVAGVMVAGDRLVGLRRETALVPEGAMFLIGPGVSHACRPLGREQGYRAVCVAPARAAAMTGLAPLPAFDRAAVFDADLIRAVLDFHDLLGRPGGLLERQSLLSSLLAGLTGRYGAPHPAEPRRNQQAVDRVKAYLLSRITENPSLEEAAAQVHLSPCHLQRLFVEAAGESPLEFLLQARARLAADMLSNGVSATEAAQACGFYDQSHFTRHFKRIVGVSPGRFALLNAKKGSG